MITNVSIRVIDNSLIDFFYPNYTRLKEYSPFIDGGVIFEGDSKYLQMFRDSNIPYIYVKGTPEYDLTIPTNLLEFVFNKWGKKPTKVLTEYFNSLDYKNDKEEIELICKQIWITGKYTLNEDVEKKIQDFYGLLSNKGTYELISSYISLSESMNSDKLFNRVRYFLDKMSDPGSVKSVYLQEKLRNFKTSRGSNVKNALMNYLYSDIENDVLRMSVLLDSITEMKW